METVGSARLDANHTTPIPATIGHRPKNRMLALDPDRLSEPRGCAQPLSGDYQRYKDRPGPYLR
jgi:hypothetical protein